MSNRRDFLAGLLTAATGVAGTWRAALTKEKETINRIWLSPEGSLIAGVRAGKDNRFHYLSKGD